MPDNDNNQTTTQQADGPEQLREAKERAEARAKKYHGQLMESAFTSLGLDPNKGIGKAVAEKYEGEPIAADISAFAVEEYSWEPPTPDPDPTPDPTPAQQIQQPAQQRVDDALKQSTPADTPTLDSQIAAAEEKGDWQKSMALKAQQVAAKMS